MLRNGPLLLVALVGVGGLVGFGCMGRMCYMILPIVSIVVPFLASQTYLFQDPAHKTGQPKKGATMETFGRAI